MPKEQIMLLVEDDDDDAELLLMAFAKARLANSVLRVRDGMEALDYLFARGSHASRDPSDLPAVVLLDLNLPRVPGLEVLAAIRAQKATKYLPVVVLTSSDEEQDRLAAYAQHANSYVRKPVDYGQFTQAAGELGLYWFVRNRPMPADAG